MTYRCTEKYCTNCPKRAECHMLRIFYDDDEYERIKEATFAKMALGYVDYTIPYLSGSLKAMDKRREHEMAIHPTYAP